MRICQRELLRQVIYHVCVALMVFPLLIHITVVVVRIFAQQNDAARIFISKQRNSRIHPLLQVAETDDIAKGLDAVQDTVCPAERLNQTVHLQILIHPKGVQGRGIKACQEHIDHDQQVKLLVLHAERYIFVVILESFAIGRVVRMEHLIVILNGCVQKIPAALVEVRGVFRVFLVQNPVCFGFVGSIAVNGGNAQPLGRVCRHLLLEFLIIQLRHRHRSHAENRIKAADTLLLLDFLHRTTLGRGNLRHIRQQIELIRFVSPIGFLVEVVKDVLGHQRNALGCHERLFPVDIPNLLVIHVRLCVHRLDVVHTERQHILVVDGIHDGVGVQLVAERLRRGEIAWISGASCVDCKNRRSCKAEQVVLFEIVNNGLVHITELAAVALVKDDHNMLLVDLMPRIFLDESRQLLDGSNDDMSFRVFQLAFQNRGAGVGVCRSLLEAVIFLHGLVVQVLAVYHEQHLVDIGQLRCQPCRFERSQRLAGASGVPDVAAAFDAAILFVVVGDLDAIQNPLRCRNLVGTHHHQHLF